MSDVELKLYNTLTRSKERFVPIDPKNVRMYVCGPTVYDYAHIGNARPVIVFDVLYRLLKHLYPGQGDAADGSRVTYVRNITDVDDKINARALETHGEAIAAGAMSLNEAVREVTEKTATQFHEDMAALGCLKPTHEPRATEFVLPREDGKTDMESMIQTLIDKGHAYVAKGEKGREVLFRVASMKDYGALSNRKLDEQQAGARIAVEDHKENSGDFVLWKESSENEPGWDGTFNGEAIRGRPGWHIECSAMAEAYLGETFDIHGGGLDLIFPHHENEIAQSRCVHDTEVMANIWMHNGFLQVEGQKMSKSLGNFHTVHDVLHTEKVGGHKWPGEVVRLAMLMTHYREPIDFSVKRLEEAERLLKRWERQVREHQLERHSVTSYPGLVLGTLNPEQNHYLKLALGELLVDDLNFSLVVTMMRGMSSDLASTKKTDLQRSLSYDLLGVLVFFGFWTTEGLQSKTEIDPAIQELIDERTMFITVKNWPEADRIRDELLAQGIQLKDSKDPETGERVTTWEVKQ